MKITVICENSVSIVGSRDLIGEHGSAYLIEDGKTVTLFDTGQGLALLNNLKVMGKDVHSIDRIIISHGHYDHTGGLLAVLRAMGKTVPVYIHTDAFIKKMRSVRVDGEQVVSFIGMECSKEEYEEAGARFIPVGRLYHVDETFACISEIERDKNWMSQDARLKIEVDSIIQDDPFNDDLSLIIQSDKGPVVLLGCAHAGIVEILEDIHKETGLEKIYAVIGGMHLNSAPMEYIDHAIEKMWEYDVRLVAPCHCTGFAASTRMAAAFKKNFQQAAVGISFEF